MRAIAISRFGGPEVLTLCQKDKPEPGKGDVRVRIMATAVNRADVLQRQGFYPPPSDASPDVPGLEFAGVVDACGDGVSQWNPGDRVFGLAGGGTYAEYILVPAATLARVPERLSFTDAAAVPEVFITAYDAMVAQAGLACGKWVLLSAVGSGVGTAAVQIARAIGAFSIGTARTQAKLEQARALGLDQGIVPVDGAFADQVLAGTGGRGADLALELVGGKYVGEDVKCLASGGWLMIVGLVAGARTELDLGMVLRKRLTIKGTTLRMRPLEEKILAARLLSENLVPLFERGLLKPVVDKVFALEEADKAHAHVDANDNFGKVVLSVG